MGRPEADSSSYQTDHPPPEYQYEAAPTGDDVSQHINETGYNGAGQVDQSQNQFTDTFTNDPQQQQQQYQQQTSQYSTSSLSSPQANLGYSSQPPDRPAPYPPPAPENSPMHPHQPTVYPSSGPQAVPAAQYQPQNTNQPAAYPPAQPAQFAPRSPQTNPMYSVPPNKAAPYPPQGQQQIPQAFPPQPYFQGAAYQAPQSQAMPGYNMPQSPLKPIAQQNMASQGIPVNHMQPYNEMWKTGLFDCMDDPTNALITACLPCVTFGQIAEIVDNGGTTCATSGLLYGAIAFCIGVPCVVSCGYRSKLRAKYALMESPAPDWLTHCLFECCALCQEYRELQHRGLDPAIGWQGNLAKQNMQQAQVGMVPPMNQRMMP